MFSNKNLPSIVDNEGKIDSDSIMRPIQTEFLCFSLFTAEIGSFDNGINSKLGKRVSNSQTKIVSTPDQMHALELTLCRKPLIILFCKSVFIADNVMVDRETRTEPCYLKSCTV